mgnify:CR=1 FL=1
MAPIVFDDLNVFTFAHSRMRKLMNCCTSKVTFSLVDLFFQIEFERLGWSYGFHKFK